jgi:hypothetical protein
VGEQSGRLGAVDEKRFCALTCRLRIVECPVKPQRGLQALMELDQIDGLGNEVVRTGRERLDAAVAARLPG